MIVSLLAKYLSGTDHSIIASASYDEAMEKYSPIASILWEKVDGTLGIEIITNLPNTCATCTEASNLAVEIANAWIDRKLS